MDDSLNLYLDPRRFDTQELTAGVRSILLTRNGETIPLEPLPAGFEVKQEHPPVERMDGDLGAICEVFKQSSTYYLTLPGISLVPGDRLTLAYRHKPQMVILTVVELENGKARIDPPEIH